MATWTTLTDEALIAATPRERAAFGVFYERHERSVLGFFGAVTRRPELAADLTAETRPGSRPTRPGSRRT